MTEVIKAQVDVEDLLDQYKPLLKDLNERLNAVEGADDAKQVKRLQRQLKKHSESIAQALKGLTPRLRLVIGDTVMVGTDKSGTVVASDGEDIEIRVAEQVIPEHIVPEHTVKAFWHERTEGWIDYETRDEWLRDE